MQQYSYIPRPPLSQFIELLWINEGYAPQHRRERALPDGSVELIINLHEDRLPVFERGNSDRFQFQNGTLVYGAHSEYFVIDATCQVSIMGVHFKPGGAFPFLGLPAGELHNQVVALDNFWGLEVCFLREQLLAAKTILAKFRILEAALRRQALLPLEQHRAVTFALSHFQHIASFQKMTAVTEQIGLSQKRFIDVFRRSVGLTPKLFCRIRRFQSVLPLLERASKVDWAEVALTCGYFDQAHFIHDFREFSGLNPTLYQAHQGERRNHPIHA
jgi:AraC-like DNA-binding protein